MLNYYSAFTPSGVRLPFRGILAPYYTTATKPTTIPRTTAAARGTREQPAKLFSDGVAPLMLVTAARDVGLEDEVA